MKICVVTAIYTISGVPLAQWRLARALASRGHEVDFVIGRIAQDCPIEDVPGITVVDLSCTQVRSMFIPLWRYLRSCAPEVVFSAEDHLNATVLLAAIASRSAARISGSSRVTPYDTYSNRPFSKRWFLKQVMRSVMWRANALTCVSKDMVEQYRQVFDSPPHVDVYNIVDDPSSRLKMQEPLEHEWFVDKDCPVLVAAGQLAPWKGFADLIQAAHRVAQHRRVRLLILGEGALRAELQSLIDQLNLTDTVRLQGNVDNPLKYYAHADAFVLSSHVEGMPNVLVEAMLCGCTPVSTTCPTGPRELLQDGKYGYLAPMQDPAALATAIERALDYPIPAARLAEAVQPFAEDVVINRHFEILGLCANSST